MTGPPNPFSCVITNSYSSAPAAHGTGGAPRAAAMSSLRGYLRRSEERDGREWFADGSTMLARAAQQATREVARAPCAMAIAWHAQCVGTRRRNEASQRSSSDEAKPLSRSEALMTMTPQQASFRLGSRVLVVRAAAVARVGALARRRGLLRGARPRGGGGGGPRLAAPLLPPVGAAAVPRGPVRLAVPPAQAKCNGLQQAGARWPGWVDCPGRAGAWSGQGVRQGHTVPFGPHGRT
eukprot:gene1719-biopygen4841